MTDSNKPITIEELKLLLSEQTKEMRDSFVDELKAATDEIKANVDSKLAQMNDKIEAVKTNVQAQPNEMKSDIERCKQQHPGEIEDDLNQISKLNELKLNSISHASNQDLGEIFNAIASIVNFDINDSNNKPTLSQQNS